MLGNGVESGGGGCGDITTGIVAVGVRGKCRDVVVVVLQGLGEGVEGDNPLQGVERLVEAVDGWE